MGAHGYYDNSESSVSSQEDDFNEDNMQIHGNDSNKYSTNKRNLEDTILEHTSSKEQQKENSLFLSVSVTDSGCGMNDEMKKKCFVLFGNLKFKKDIN